LLYEMIHDSSVCYAMHTNFDSSPVGFRKHYVANMGLKDVIPMCLSDSAQAELQKLVVYVPREHTDRVASALFDAGCGYIGNYSCCSFRTEGTGTFIPLEGTRPWQGVQGKLEHASEHRLELIIPATLSEKAVSAIKKVHPYEEVAYELYPLQNRDPRYALGFIGSLDCSFSVRKHGVCGTNGYGVLQEFARTVAARACSIKGFRVGGAEKPQGSIRRVAVVPGSGAKAISEAASRGADVLVTADVKYYDYQLARDLGLGLVVLQHNSMEIPFVRIMGSLLREMLPGEPVHEYVCEEEAPFEEGVC
ncbi:MAG: Nif3-like dinuclear metal center hexameric protein, partial [Oligoflexales bacterium]|nr:Nif3-like dinuclear metal center hexameric protein [Oligoflexales bacterium]